MNASAQFVTVGCKLPTGLHLDLKAKDGVPARVTLKGANAARIIGGYGLTEQVPAEFITEWLKQNAKHPAVINKHIFIHSETASAESIAKEHRELKTGLEPIDPIANGMLKGANGQPTDPEALKAYNQQRATNPARNQQQVE